MVDKTIASILLLCDNSNALYFINNDIYTHTNISRLSIIEIYQIEMRIQSTFRVRRPVKCELDANASHEYNIILKNANQIENCSFHTALRQASKSIKYPICCVTIDSIHRYASADHIHPTHRHIRNALYPIIFTIALSMFSENSPILNCGIQRFVWKLDIIITMGVFLLSIVIQIPRIFIRHSLSSYGNDKCQIRSSTGLFHFLIFIWD